jgi:hypothetical protein
MVPYGTYPARALPVVLVGWVQPGNHDHLYATTWRGPFKFADREYGEVNVSNLPVWVAIKSRKPSAMSLPSQAAKARRLRQEICIQFAGSCAQFGTTPNDQRVYLGVSVIT